MRHHAIARTPVASSSIASIGYDPSREELHVEFSSGRTYRYAGVDAETHAKLLAAPSIGSHFSSHIRRHYAGEPLI